MFRRTACYWITAAVLFSLPIPSRAGSSNSLLDLSPDGAWLLVANRDNGTVTVLDTGARKAVREIPVGEEPEAVCWIGNGPNAAVTLYREDKVVFFNAHDGGIIKKLSVPD